MESLELRGNRTSNVIFVATSVTLLTQQSGLGECGAQTEVAVLNCYVGHFAKENEERELEIFKLYSVIIYIIFYISMDFVCLTANAMYTRLPNMK